MHTFSQRSRQSINEQTNKFSEVIELNHKLHGTVNCPVFVSLKVVVQATFNFGKTSGFTGT